jgi:hypothetical protein
LVIPRLNAPYPVGPRTGCVEDSLGDAEATALAVAVDEAGGGVGAGTIGWP